MSLLLTLRVSLSLRLFFHLWRWSFYSILTLEKWCSRFFTIIMSLKIELRVRILTIKIVDRRYFAARELIFLEENASRYITTHVIYIDWQLKRENLFSSFFKVFSSFFDKKKCSLSYLQFFVFLCIIQSFVRMFLKTTLEELLKK